MADEVKRYAMIFPDQRQFVKLLTREQRGDIFDAIFDYLDGEEPQFNDQVLQVVFLVFKQAIDRGMEISVARKNARKAKKQEQDETNENKTEQKKQNGTNKNKTEQNAYNNTRTIQEQNNNINPPISPQGECEKKETIISVLDEQPDEIRAALVDFVEHRKRIKAPLSPHALRLNIARLNDLAPNDTTQQKQIINEAIMNGWKSFYLPREAQQAQANPFKFDLSFAHEERHV